MCWGATEGQVSPPEQAQYDFSNIKKSFMLKGSFCCLLSCYAFPLEKVFPEVCVALFLSSSMNQKEMLIMPIAVVSDVTCTSSSLHLDWICLLLSPSSSPLTPLQLGQFSLDKQCDVHAYLKVSLPLPTMTPACCQGQANTA